jgi:hypothetical protein
MGVSLVACSQPSKKGVDHSSGVQKLKGSSEHEVPIGDVPEREEREEELEERAGCSQGISGTGVRGAFLRDAAGKSMPVRLCP